MPLEDEYPKSSRNATRQLAELLKPDRELGSQERDEVAMGLNLLADKARDLDEIFGRLLHEPHTRGEVGELLIAFQLTLGQILGASDFVNGKLYDVGDRLKGVKRSTQAKPPARRKSGPAATR